MNKLFDIYPEYDNVVNLAAVNRMAGERTEVDPAIAELVSAGKEYFELTRGAVNIAMGAVLRLWHDARINAEEDPEHASLPDEAALAEAKAEAAANAATEVIEDTPAPKPEEEE